MHLSLIRQDDYLRISRANAGRIRALQDIIRRTGEEMEGNCMYVPGLPAASPSLSHKQRNLHSLASVSNRILEIGFNAGHSALVMLLANPNASIIAFDLCEHVYTRECFEYLNGEFPGRLQLIPGDSRRTLPEYRSSHPETRFDLFHIDGGHSVEIAQTDFFNCRAMARENSLVVLDDVNREELEKVWLMFCHMSLVSEIFNVLPTPGVDHAVGVMMNLEDPLQNTRWIFTTEGQPAGELFFDRLNSLKTSWGDGVWYKNRDETYTASWQDRHHVLTLDRKRDRINSIRQDDGVMTEWICRQEVGGGPSLEITRQDLP